MHTGRRPAGHVGPGRVGSGRSTRPVAASYLVHTYVSVCLVGRTWPPVVCVHCSVQHV